MSKIKTLLKLITDPRQMVVYLATIGAFNHLSDKLYLKLMYWGVVGKHLNLENPRSFTEKLQWLKIYDRKEQYITLVDKLSVKKLVGSAVGQDYIVPTLGVWESTDQIDFCSLPNKFVLKCNHDSGSVVVCKDKDSFDYDSAIFKLNKKLHRDLYFWGREWPYRFVKRLVFAEEYLENDNNDFSDLIDYKIFCFKGKPEYCQVITDRFTDERIDFFDMEWVHQPFVGLNPNVRNSTKKILKPKHFDKMKEIATVLGKEMCFCRVDFYDTNGKLYFGEITLYPAAGFGKFTPEEWDIYLGEKLKLPK